MTCIVGVAEQGSVWIGGDSAGVAGWVLAVRKDAKVFTRGPMVFGFTTSFRMGQILRYSLHIPDHRESLPVEEYMATLFVDAVRTALKEGGYAEKQHSRESGGTFLVGYQGRLFQIGEDYQVGESTHGFDAVGSGNEIALGALWQSRESSNPQDRILDALGAAEQFCASVRGPFMIGSNQ